VTSEGSSPVCKGKARWKPIVVPPGRNVDTCSSRRSVLWTCGAASLCSQALRSFPANDYPLISCPSPAPSGKHVHNYPRNDLLTIPPRVVNHTMKSPPPHMAEPGTGYFLVGYVSGITRRRSDHCVGKRGAQVAQHICLLIAIVSLQYTASSVQNTWIPASRNIRGPP
jgi:hypothetical protein